MQSDFIRNVDESKKRAETELQLVLKVILEKIKPSPGPFALPHHNAHCLVRIRDVGWILIRMNKNMRRINKLNYILENIRPKNHPGGVPYPEDMQRIYRIVHELEEYMKIDYESIFLFGDILLDQWSLTVAYLVGFPKPSEFSFYRLIEHIEKESKSGRLSKVWEAKRAQMIWLDSHIRFYRNRFITHVDRP
ncbi:MAG: hypothetical protein PHG40_03740, partial [Candidatus Omnitrophica bacterium]|nr:hypothetical protein [Candidatus Omnitrophota bacterium]